MAEQKQLYRSQRFGKADVRYWEGKLFHDGYIRNGKRVASPDWSVRIKHGGQRDSFPLGTPNKAAAAAKARDIFQCLKGAGWDEACRRYKPHAAKPEMSETTVGDFLEATEAISGIRPKTFADYVKALRLIVAEVFGIDGGVQKFNPHTGGRNQWLEKVSAIKLVDLTPEHV